MTGTELTVLGLSVALVLASIFVVVAFFVRFGTGFGLAPAPTAVSGPVAATATRAPAGTSGPTEVAPIPTLGPAVRVEPLYTPTPTPEPTVPTPTPYVRVPAASPPTRLAIPRIELDIPVLEVGIKTVREGSKPKAVWADVPNAGGFHQTSAYPGNGGNTVINGHRDVQGSVFRHLDQVGVGDEILLYVDDVLYPYLVSERLIVPEVFASAEQRAENLQLIGTMPEERLTLITCTPVGLATHRLVVIAHPSAPTFPQMPQAGSDTSP
jgi:sortase A